jgi:hypothetical protein
VIDGSVAILAFVVLILGLLARTEKRPRAGSPHTPTVHFLRFTNRDR